MAQLKMYWFCDEHEVPEIVLPEGYSFSHFSESTYERDVSDWNECIRTWEHSDETDEERFEKEIYGYTDIVPEEDVWFLDYNGEHIGTSTSFTWSSSGIGDMHWVGIKKAYRGKGLSKYLSLIIQKTLKERGVKIISLTTSEGRPAAVKSYLTAGFLPVEYDEGMEERWAAVLKKYGIDSIQMVNEDGTPYKVVFAAE